MLTQIKLSIRNFIKRTFHDEIIAIEEPREWWVEYKDVGRRLEGYIIPVTYKYRGNQNTYSIIDNDHLHIITKERALREAQKFYAKVQKKIASRNENTK